MKYRSLTPATIAVVVTFAINQAAQFYGWYEIVPFFDKYMHVLGGVFIALLGVAYMRRPRVLFLLGLVLFVGLLWEGYEYGVDAIFRTDLIHLKDSAGDLVADMIGGIIVCGALFFVQRAKKRYNTFNAK